MPQTDHEKWLDHEHMKALAERGIRDLRDWLEAHDSTTLTHLMNGRTLDFTIGDFEEDWPDRMEGLPVIQGSSVSIGMGPAWADGDSWEEGRYVQEANVHLPPTHEFRQDVIAERLNSLSDRFFVHFGTTNQMAGFGAVNDAPDGVVTPHVMVASPMSFEDLRGGIETCLDIYEGSVYEEGDNVLLEVP